MLEKYIPKRFATALLKHVIAVTLLFPYFWAHVETIYYQDFILATAFAVLFMVSLLSSWKMDFSRNRVLVCILGTLLIAYNVFATYINANYHHWFGDQINTTLAFLFFILLLMVKDKDDLLNENVLKSSIQLIVLSNILAMMYRSLNKYSSFLLFNKTITQNLLPGDQKPFSWLYFHKSQYAVVLILCIAFFAVYQNAFRNKITYALCQGLLLVALFITDSYTSMVAALFIFAGQFADYWWKAKWRFKLISLVLFTVPFAAVAKKIFALMAEARNTSTLGSRTMIWPAFIGHILDNPHGIGEVFGNTTFHVDGNFFTNNAHNVFLNHMFRFSIPVGAIYILIMLVIIIYSLIRNFSFMTLGIWIALLLPMFMDYALFTSELPFFLFIIYCIFFHKKKDTKERTK